MWRAVGYFPSDEAGALLSHTFGPEADRDAAGAFAGKGGAQVGWVDLTEREDGFLDLRQVDADPAKYEDAVAFAQTWVYSPDEREVLYAMGSDDGCRLWIGDELVYETAERRGALPLSRLAKARLAAGWNRVLLGVENGNGAFGLYFRVLDDEVRFARRPE